MLQELSMKLVNWYWQQTDDNFSSFIFHKEVDSSQASGSVLAVARQRGRNSLYFGQWSTDGTASMRDYYLLVNRWHSSFYYIDHSDTNTLKKVHISKTRSVIQKFSTLNWVAAAWNDCTTTMIVLTLCVD